MAVQTLAPPLATTPTRRRFSVADYYRMAEVGILAPDERVELLDGEVTLMTPIGSRHAGSVNLLTEELVSRLGRQARVAVQNPVLLADASAPQPDIAVLRSRADGYAGGHPTPADVLLLIEVADTTLAVDRGLKVRLYAEAGIPEYWIVDLAGRRVERYTEPTSGTYSRREIVAAAGSLTPTLLPDVQLPVAAILPPDEAPATTDQATSTPPK